MAGYVPFDPKKPLQQPATAPTPTGGYIPPATIQGYGNAAGRARAQAQLSPADGGGYVPFNPNGGQQTDSAAAGPGWSIDWSKPGGQVTMPQSVQDFGDIAGNEAGMGLPGLRVQTDAARQRLGPAASAVADVAGNILSPTTLLNAVPYVGPELAGGAHEGIKSYAAGNDWKTIGEDALGGVAFGALGQGAARIAPEVLPQLTKQGVQLGLAHAANKLGLGHVLPE